MTAPGRIWAEKGWPFSDTMGAWDSEDRNGTPYTLTSLHPTPAELREARDDRAAIKGYAAMLRIARAVDVKEGTRNDTTQG